MAGAILADVMLYPLKTGSGFGAQQLVKDDFLCDIWEDADALFSVDGSERSGFTVAGLRDHVAWPDAAIPTGILVPADFLACPFGTHEVHLAIVIDIHGEVCKVIPVAARARALAPCTNFTEFAWGKPRVAIPGVT